MKKVLSILSTFILTSSATLVLTGTVDTHNQQTKNENKTGINWNDVKNQINRYFSKIKNDNKDKLVIYSEKSNSINFDEAMKYAQEKSNEYITRFENQNLNFNKITNILLNENSNFRESYQNALQQQNQINNKLNNSTLLKTNIKSLFSDDLALIEFNQLDQRVQNLKIIEISFTTVATAAVIAAAAFFAAAFFTFGATSAWATGCSIIAATLGLAAAILDLVLLKYNKERGNLEERISTGMITFNDVFTLGHLPYTILSASLPAIEGTLSATVWAFPAGVALIGVIAGILSWISFYK